MTKNTPISKKYPFKTSDGWNIILHRYENKSDKNPILLIHGLASNRHSFDLPLEGRSLAKYLWKEGWDVWSIDLRGSGESSPLKKLEWFFKHWTFDHYVEFDIPEAIHFIQKTTRKKKIHWIGHSMGGLLVYPYIRLHSNKDIKSITTIATPISTEHKPAYFKWVTLIDPLFRWIPLFPYKKLAALGKFDPKLIYKYQPEIFVADNLDLDALSLGIEHAIEDVSSGVMRQLNRWLNKQCFNSTDGSVDYTLDPEKMTTPIMLLNGSKDPFTPQETITPIFDRFKSKKKKLVIVGGEDDPSHFGHFDMIVGKHSPKVVYPVVKNWLKDVER